MKKTRLEGCSEAEYKSAIKTISDTESADIVSYTGHMWSPGCYLMDELISGVESKRENVILFLTTFGGSADEAYRIARALQSQYSKVILYVDSYCKSAGTLVALGAHKLVLRRTAELGPIDVQILKKDEVGERTSGLTPVQALKNLQAQASETFIDHFNDFQESLGVHLTTASITRIAGRLTVGGFSPIYQHIDPMKLAEHQRASLVAMEYGNRLSKAGKNIKNGTVARLISGYPSHEFVIDINEVKELFASVQEADASYMLLGNYNFGRCLSILKSADKPPEVRMLTDPNPEDQSQRKEKSDGPRSDRARKRSSPKPGGEDANSSDQSKSKVASRVEGSKATPSSPNGTAGSHPPRRPR